MIHKTLGHSLTSYHSTTDCLIHAIHAIQKLGMKQLPASQASQADLPPVRNDKSHDFSQLPKKKKHGSSPSTFHGLVAHVAHVAHQSSSLRQQLEVPASSKSVDFIQREKGKQFLTSCSILLYHETSFKVSRLQKVTNCKNGTYKTTANKISTFHFLNI